VRLFDYQLKLGLPTLVAAEFSDLASRSGLEIAGSKRVSYTRRGNPWSQLMRMELSHLAGLTLGPAKVLEVQPAYFAAKRLPLMRVVAQQDQPSALIDLMAFGAYLARVMLNIHIWSLRKPDDHYVTPAPPQRLPGRLSRLPSWLSALPRPDVHQFKPDGANDDAEIRLTAYRQPRSDRSRGPVLMIHGYSASGTSFAHKLLRPSLAAHLWDQGFEPWVLDLRSSSGMPSADRPYTFEEIALADIPAALHKVCQATGQAQVDVITHCMGSAMLAMTLQSTTPSGPQAAARIRRWVMSQFGPRMRFSPANLLRAYLISYFREALPDYRYSLKPGNEVPGAGGSFYDRFINTLPYLGEGEQSEFDVENPWWQFWCRTPWVGTRHRLDALIGRTFDARQMAPDVLDRIDDFFGPINLRTMSQPIFFAQMGEVAGAQGLEPFGRNAAPLLRHAPMLSLHGKTNGLADIETAKLLRQWADQGGLDLTQRCYASHGHQDLLIGRDCAAVFKDISDFLMDPLLPDLDKEHGCAR
jgi:cholesterol oxidase